MITCLKSFKKSMCHSVTFQLGFKQYIPLKRARFGVKSLMLCEDSGYTFSFKIYSGKENVALAVQELSVSERVVIGLMQPLLQKGYHLYTDNWYTSLPLYKEGISRAGEKCQIAKR